MQRHFAIPSNVLVTLFSVAFNAVPAASLIFSQQAIGPATADITVQQGDDRIGAAIALKKDAPVASLHKANHTASIVWIASWPHSGSTTFYHMIMAAALEAHSDADAAMAFEYDGRRGSQLHVPERPPSEPGCWVLKQSSSLERPLKWTRDNHAGSHVNRTACETRRSSLNKRSNVAGNAVLFIPAPNYTANRLKRRFGLFEPCHRWYGTMKTADVVAGEHDGNCNLTMSRLLRCDFAGMEYLWGWDHPNTDITGVTPVGASPPSFSRGLAHKSCARSDLILYNTVHDFGRKAANVVEMLKTYPNVTALVPVRDPRGIYASWKKFGWNFPGVSLLTEICNQMAENAHIRHHRLIRVHIERLVEKPARVMRRVYDRLGYDFGVAQERWINNTISAACSASANEGNELCFDEATEPMVNWEKVLTEDEKRAFETYPTCVEAVEVYGYKLDNDALRKTLGVWW